MDIKTVGLACDHASFPLKKFVIQYLEDHSFVMILRSLPKTT